MSNKELQEQRMRSYFMEATKSLLKGEGLRSVNVRSIASEAGYSYATLYNYFKDIKELVFLCVEDFQKECAAEIAESVKKIPAGKKRIEAITKAYIAFFVQYPGLFHLFFIEKMGDLGHKQPTAHSIYTFLDKICENDWQACIEQEKVNSQNSGHIRTGLNFVTAGMLLFYMNRMQPESYAEFMEQVNTQIEFMLQPIAD